MQIQDMNGKIPTSGNAFSRWLGRTVLRWGGWRIEGAFPDEPKILAVGAPHTSNWDFVYSLAAMLALGVRASWLGKSSLFRPPLGWFLRRVGGIPVDRKAAHGMVVEIVRAFNQHDQLVLGVTPEGTRKQVNEWKTGFYHIADAARVPMALVYWDYENRVFGFGPSFLPTGDKDADIARIKDFYRPVRGKFAQTIR